MKAQPLTLLPDTDPILRQVAEPIEEITEEIKAFAGQLSLTMTVNKGIGIAAPQVGRSIRLILVQMHTGYLYTMINPEIIYKSSATCDATEGCLSFPDVFEDIPRAERVRVKYTDLKGQNKSLMLAGWDARVVQHEIDHLNGVLFVDYLE